MRDAIQAENAPLSTGEVPAEHQFIQVLVAGAIGAFRNASNHRSSDSTTPAKPPTSSIWPAFCCALPNARPIGRLTILRSRGRCRLKQQQDHEMDLRYARSRAAEDSNIHRAPIVGSAEGRENGPYVSELSRVNDALTPFQARTHRAEP